MTNQRYEQLIDTIPYGLAHATLRVLNFHTGREHAIGRFELLEALIKMGLDAHERQVRRCIHELRRAGRLILAMPGIDGGYYIATSLQEFDEFDRYEFGAKIADMNETRLAMKKAAKIQFGDASQIDLF